MSSSANARRVHLEEGAGASGCWFSAELPPSILELAPIEYRNPHSIQDGRVLVAGASASGAQIASELARSGKEVTLAAGNHVRLPRRYRGMDIHWWLDSIGALDESWTEVEDLPKARRTPSLQLVGSTEARNLDLNTLTASGVQLVGKLVGLTGASAQFSDRSPTRLRPPTRNSDDSSTRSTSMRRSEDSMMNSSRVTDRLAR